MYYVLLNNVEIGTTLLEFGDPPMGVVSGKVVFNPSISPFNLFFGHCQTHGIVMNLADHEDEAIDTHSIPELRVVRADGVEIKGQGCSIMGLRKEGYVITIVFISYPFYAEEFPHHRQQYDEQSYK